MLRCVDYGSRGNEFRLMCFAQELDSKTISRLEKAVAKSEYSQGKKLKVVTKVSSIFTSTGPLLRHDSDGLGQPRPGWRPRRRDR